MKSPCVNTPSKVLSDAEIKASAVIMAFGSACMSEMGASCCMLYAVGKKNYRLTRTIDWVDLQ